MEEKEFNINDYKEYVGRYFFWEDLWNANYEGLFIKGVNEKDESLDVNSFHATESVLVYAKDDVIYPEEQTLWFDDPDCKEVTKEEFWELIARHTEEYYACYKDWD